MNSSAAFIKLSRASWSVVLGFTQNGGGDDCVKQKKVSTQTPLRASWSVVLGFTQNGGGDDCVKQKKYLLKHHSESDPYNHG